MKNVNIMGVHSKMEFLRGEGGWVWEKPMHKGELPKKGAGTVCSFGEGLLGEKEGVIPQCMLC